MIFEFIRSLFSFDLLVELSENKITMQKFSTGQFIEIEPWIALEGAKGKEKIKAIGRQAKSLSGPTIQTTNPFSHTRSFIGNFTLAEKILQHGIFTLNSSKLRAAPRVIMHQLEKTDGGLSDIEERVLRELASGMGAREVLIHTGSKINVRAQSYDDIKAKIKAT